MKYLEWKARGRPGYWGCGETVTLTIITWLLEHDLLLFVYTCVDGGTRRMRGMLMNRSQAVSPLDQLLDR